MGSAAGIITWLVYAKQAHGAITIATTGLNGPLIAGNATSLGASIIILVVLSYIFPDKQTFEWERLQTEITTVHDEVSSAWSLPSGLAAPH